MFQIRLFFMVVLISITVATGTSGAQDPEARRSELGIRQKLVERKMVELETKFTVIAERLQEKEPERAKRLIAAYQQSKEKLITRQMAQVGQLLDQGKFQLAETQLDEVIENLEALIRLLTNEKEQTLTKQEEMQMLERWKQNIQERIREQQIQSKETENVAHKEEAVNKLEAQIKKLESLIQQQRDVIKATEEQKNAGLRALDKVADKQFEVRQGTEALGKELGGQQPKDGKPGDGKPGDQKPVDEKPSDGKPSDGKPSDGKPSDEKPSDEKPSDGKPSDGKPSDGKPSDGKPGDEQSQPPSPPQPGQQALEKAAQHQQRAEEKLGSGKSENAKNQEEDALKEMDKALAEIQKEKRRIESLPPEALEQMADQQRRTRDKSMDVLEEMKKAPQPKPNPNDQNADQSPQQPGQQPMEDAGDAMQQASNELQDQNAEEAQKNQDKAAEKLAEAIEEIEERLNQLREETREEKLARLEARFREMLDRQQVASIITIELNDKRTNLGDLHRRDQLLLLRMANEESEISEIGQQAYDLLLEDGTSIVFPEIVQELRDDLGQAAQLLQDERTDRFTQLVQQEIETTIEDLIDALKEAQDKKESGGGGGGGGGGKQPLLKMSAELKILKMQQLRLNRRTKKVNQMRGEPDLEPLLDNEALKAADLQSKLLEMTEGIMEKQQPQ